MFELIIVKSLSLFRQIQILAHFSLFLSLHSCNISHLHSGSSISFEIVDRDAELEGPAAAAEPEVLWIQSCNITVEHHDEGLILHEERCNRIKFVSTQSCHILWGGKSKFEAFDAYFLWFVCFVHVERVLILFGPIQYSLRANLATVLHNNNDKTRIVWVWGIFLAVLVVFHDHCLAKTLSRRGTKEIHPFAKVPLVVLIWRVRHFDRS